MQNIPLGRYSCFLAVLVWLGLCVGVVALALPQNQLYFFKHETGQRILTYWFFSGLGMALLGVGLAIGGLLQADRKKVLAVLGLIFNGLVLLGGVGVFYNDVIG